MNRMNYIRLGSWLMIILTLLAIFIAPLLAQGRGVVRTELRELSEGQRTIDSNKRMIEFAGWQWFVKSGCGLGPGPNCWSDSEESVWVDDREQLHLKIRKIGDTWHAAEVYTVACTQYGMHRFFMDGPLDNLDKNVVAAPFLYKDDFTEIDIEFAKWGEENPPTNAQYVVQPWDNPGNQETFSMPLTGTLSTHYIDWSASSIQFKSIQGHHEEPPSEAHLIHTWVYTGPDNPAQEECLKVHINLWLYRGNPPSDGQEAEIIVQDVELPPKLEVIKQASSALVQPGVPLTYTIRVVNTGNVDLHATVTDTLPMHIITGETPDGTVIVPGGILTWTPLITAPGGVWVQTVPITAETDYTGLLTNRVQVTTEEGATGMASVTVCSNQCSIYLPLALKNYSPPWITVMASGRKAWGEVGPSSFCNSDYKVALYAKKDIWYVQPFEAEPSRNVQIASDCTWTSSTHSWDQMAAHLVPASYFHPNRIYRGSCLPLPLNPATNSNVLAASCYPHSVGSRPANPEKAYALPQHKGARGYRY